MSHWNIKVVNKKQLMFEYLMGDVFYLAKHFEDKEAFDYEESESSHEKATKFSENNEEHLKRAYEFNRRLEESKKQKMDDEMWNNIIARNVKSLKNSKTKKEVVGFVPHVPNAIQNLPKSMLTSLPTKKLNSKPIEMFVNLSANWTTSDETLNSMGISAYYLIKILETMGYQINLKLITATESNRNDQFEYFTHSVPIKNASTKITASLFVSFFQNYSKFFRGQLFYVYARDIRNKKINYSNRYISQAFWNGNLGRSSFSHKDDFEKFTHGNVLSVHSSDIPEYIKTFKDVLSGVSQFAKSIKDKDIKYNLEETLKHLKNLPEAQ